MLVWAGQSSVELNAWSRALIPWFGISKETPRRWLGRGMLQEVHLQANQRDVQKTKEKWLARKFRDQGWLTRIRGLAQVYWLTQKQEDTGAELFFRSRLRGHEAGDAIVDDKLAVVFAGMLDETVGHV